MPTPALISERYELGDLIGQGGMGAVYAGHDTQTGQVVAIKLLKPELVAAPDAVARFAREGEALRALAHPNIVAVLAIATGGDQHAIVMEYVPGGSLADLLHAQPQLPIARTLQIALDLSDALARVHRLNIVHRDLKPANVLLAADGTPRLTDFGVAALGGQPHLTQTGALIGTLPYLSPEGWRGEALDARADIWAFGVLLYELLAGRPPFDASQPAVLMHAILNAPAPDLRILRPDVPNALAALIDQMLLKERERRLSSVRQVGLTAEALLRGGLPTVVLPREDVPVVSPSAPTLAAPPPGNLPTPPTAFIGRAKELAFASRLLRHADVRLLTLTGSGGTGKTRLSLKVAAEARDAFPNGVWFVNLAPIRDPSLVIPTIAQVLDVRELAGQSLVESLKRELRAKQLLLLLDNFEQVADAAPLVSELLAAAAGLKVLVTSRVALHLYGEQEFPVPPLALPDPRRATPVGTDSVAALAEYDSLALFAARTRAVKPDFAVTKENATAVAEICVRLDGLPLAIELAAARVKLFPPQALLTRLDNRLKLLTGGARDLPARQQTLRGAIDWSYDLLDEGERALFAQLGVFVGGCTLAAAAAVLNSELRVLSWEADNSELRTQNSELDVLDGLVALVDKNLLRQIEGPDGEPRFVMLETIREYALERLQISGATDLLRQRHAACYLALAERIEPDLGGPQQGPLLDQLEQEHDNLRAALSWALAQPQPAIGAQLCNMLWWFWFVRGYLSEGRRWLDLAFAGSRTHVESEPDVLLRAKLLNAAGVLAHDQGDYSRATALHEESLAIVRRLGRTGGVAASLNNLGLVARSQGQYARAAAYYAESLALRRAAGDDWSAAVALSNLGLVAQDQGDCDGAVAYFEESLALRRALGDQRGIALVLNNLGSAVFQQGDYARAAALHAESLAIQRVLADRAGMADALGGLGDVAAAQGAYGQAQRYYQESLGLRQALGDKVGVAGCLEGLAAVAMARGELHHAARLLGVATVLRDALGAPMSPIDRPRYDHVVERTRAQLGEAAFSAAWDAGRALPLEQAIVEVLR